jgi:hypothetical protein
MLNATYREGIFPSILKNSAAKPIHKNGTKADALIIVPLCFYLPFQKF